MPTRFVIVGKRCAPRPSPHPARLRRSRNRAMPMSAMPASVYGVVPLPPVEGRRAPGLLVTAKVNVVWSSCVLSS